jgi:hypothetical protein
MCAKPGLGGVTSINTGYLLPDNDYRAYRRVINNLALLRPPISSASPRMPMRTKIRQLRGSHIDAPYEPGRCPPTTNCRVCMRRTGPKCQWGALQFLAL